MANQAAKKRAAENKKQIEKLRSFSAVVWVCFTLALVEKYLLVLCIWRYLITSDGLLICVSVDSLPCIQSDLLLAFVFNFPHNW